MVGAQRIASRRDRDTLQACSDNELGHHPASRLIVVEHNRVAVVVGLTATAEALPESVAGERAGEQGAALAVDGPDEVDVLDINLVAVIIEADVAVGGTMRPPMTTALSSLLRPWKLASGDGVGASAPAGAALDWTPASGSARSGKRPYSSRSMIGTTLFSPPGAAAGIAISLSGGEVS